MDFELIGMKFVICVDNRTNPKSLIIGKVYLALPDQEASKSGMIRILDETFGEQGSEDGYLYPDSMFVPINLPQAAERALAQSYSIL